MSIYFKIYGDAADAQGFPPTDTTYSVVRDSTAATGNATATIVLPGQRFSSPNYSIVQYFAQFDTSAVPPGTGATTLTLNCTVVAPATDDSLEVREVPASTNKIAGDSLAALPLYATLAVPTTTGKKTFTFSDITALSRSSTLKLLVHSQKERLNTAPTNDNRTTFNTADVTGTTNDPVLVALVGTAWAFVAAGTSVEATATAHTLTEPAGAAAGDLLVACIGSRIASVSSITLPSGWTRVVDQTNSNTATNTSATPSGMMAYIIRGGSAPSYTFTHPVAPSVALGRVFAYRNVHQTTPFQDFQSATSATAVLVAATVTGPAAADDNLIVALAVGGQEGTWSGFTSTTGTTSGTTAASVLDPAWGQWLERSDVLTSTGSDVSMAVADYVHQTGSGTGAVSATTTLSAAQVMIVGSFRLAPTIPAGPTYDDDQEETLSAAETVAISQFVRSGPIAETAASADTVAGLLDATRVVAETAAAAETLGGLLVTEKAIAETAAAAETLTGGLAFVDTVAEAAAAVDTIGKLVSVAGAVAETVAAAETVTGQFDTTKAIDRKSTRLNSSHSKQSRMPSSV